MSQAASASSRERTGYSLAAAWPSLVVTVLVAVSAAYSFSPRAIPPFPATQVQPSQLLVNGLAAGGGVLLAAGEQGRILFSEDGGAGWREAAVQPQRGSTFTQILFTGDKTAIAVGHDGWIVRSDDGGRSWKEAHFNAELATPLLGVSGPFGGRLYAYGGFGLMLVSDNGGKSWQTKSDAAIGDHHVNAMARAADGSLIAVGERGLMVRSSDNGVTWQRLPDIYNGSFYGLLSLPGQQLVAFGMRGNVFHSTDLGRTWKKSAVPEALSLFGGNVDAQGNVILVGEAEVVLRSNDGGASFTQVSQGERKRLVAVLPQADGLVIAGESGLRVHKNQTPAAAATEPQS